MTENSRNIFLISSLLLCFVLALVIVTLSVVAPAIHLLFVPYQFFLLGICVGALTFATISLAMNREAWTNYRLYFGTIMLSAFLLVVANSLIFSVLGGKQFVRRLAEIIWFVFLSQ